MSIVLRIYCPAGRVRLDGLTPDSIWNDVINLAAGKLNCSPDSLHFSVEEDGPPLTPSGTDTVQGLGLRNGQILYASTRNDKLMAISAQCTGACKALRLDDLPAEEEATTPLSLRPTNPEEETPTESGEGGSKANFINFDEYLKKATYDLGSLPLLQNYKPRTLVKGTMFKVPPSITLKHQAFRHVDHVELMNVQSVTNFVNYWRQEKDMLIQRVGILYGYYAEYSHYEKGVKAVVEAIYEPLQCGTSDQFNFDVETVDLSAPDIVAERLGLERLGLIFTHLPREKLPLSAHEAMLCSRWGLRNFHNSHFTGYEHSTQVILTVSPDLSNGDPVTNAFMMSDLGLAVIRDGLVIGPAADPRRLRVESSSGDQLISEVLESGKPIQNYEGDLANTFDVDWLVVRLNDGAPIQVRTMLPRTTFPVINRLPIKNTHATRFFKGAKQSWGTVADWNFLLWVFTEIGPNMFNQLCEAIRNRTEIADDIWRELTEL